MKFVDLDANKPFCLFLSFPFLFCLFLRDAVSLQHGHDFMFLFSFAIPFSLARTIIEKMVEMSSVANSSDMEVIEKDVGVRVNIGQLILQQLQGLNTIADGPAMTDILKEHFE